MRAVTVAAITDGAFGEAVHETSENDEQIDGAIVVLWSQIHALTSLLVDGLAGPKKRLEQLTNHALEAVILGLSTGKIASRSETWVGPKRF